MYGGGPAGSPYLFDRDDPAKVLVSHWERGGDDVPRNEQGIALLGDPRNDLHLFVSQMHVAFLRIHVLVDRLREDGVPEASLFEEARRAAMWHYQWIVVLDFLPQLIGDELATEVLEARTAVLHPRRGAPHPARVRRRRLPVRPQPDPARLSCQ